MTENAVSKPGSADKAAKPLIPEPHTPSLLAVTAALDGFVRETVARQVAPLEESLRQRAVEDSERKAVFSELTKKVAASEAMIAALQAAVAELTVQLSAAVERESAIAQRESAIEEQARRAEVRAFKAQKRAAKVEAQIAALLGDSGQQRASILTETEEQGEAAFAGAEGDLNAEEAGAGGLSSPAENELVKAERIIHEESQHGDETIKTLGALFPDLRSALKRLGVSTREQLFSACCEAFGETGGEIEFYKKLEQLLRDQEIFKAKKQGPKQIVVMIFRGLGLEPPVQPETAQPGASSPVSSGFPVLLRKKLGPAGKDGHTFERALYDTIHDEKQVKDFLRQVDFQDLGAPKWCRLCRDLFEGKTPAFVDKILSRQVGFLAMIYGLSQEELVQSIEGLDSQLIWTDAVRASPGLSLQLVRQGALTLRSLSVLLEQQMAAAPFLKNKEEFDLAREALSDETALLLAFRGDRRGILGIQSFSREQRTLMQIVLNVPLLDRLLDAPIAAPRLPSRSFAGEPVRDSRHKPRSVFTRQNE